MTPPIRILHVFGALDSGGVSNFVMNTYRSIDKTLVQYDFALTQGASLMDEEAKSLGARLFYCDPSKSLIDNLDQIIEEKGPFEGIHSHMYFYTGLILRCAKKHSIPIRIAHAHNAYTGEPGSASRRMYESFMRYLIRSSATVMLGCSEKACRYVYGDSSMKDPRVCVLPDGIDCDRFSFNESKRQEIRERYGLNGRYVVGHVGHFNPAKNHEKILEVFCEVIKRNTNAALLLVGDGELESKIRKKVNDLGLDEDVVFAGAHTNVEDFYQAMDVFLFPSRYEGFGMAMIEAQANGLPCVASDIVPTETNATGKAVFLSLNACASVWAEALLEKSRDVSCAEFVRSKYGIKEVSNKLLTVYS